jgi:hypothetical protein
MIESRWGSRYSAPVQSCPGAHPASCTTGTVSFPGSRKRPGREADSSPLLVPRYRKKSTAIPLHSPRAFVAYDGVKPTYIRILDSILYILITITILPFYLWHNSACFSFPELIGRFLLQLPYIPPHLYPQTLIIVKILEFQKCALLLNVLTLLWFKMD